MVVFRYRVTTAGYRKRWRGEATRSSTSRRTHDNRFTSHPAIQPSACLPNVSLSPFHAIRYWAKHRRLQSWTAARACTCWCCSFPLSQAHLALPTLRARRYNRRRNRGECSRENGGYDATSIVRHVIRAERNFPYCKKLGEGWRLAFY
jgi:hypothetical protein